MRRGSVPGQIGSEGEEAAASDQTRKAIEALFPNTHSTRLTFSLSTDDESKIRAQFQKLAQKFKACAETIASDLHIVTNNTEENLEKRRKELRDNITNKVKAKEPKKETAVQSALDAIRQYKPRLKLLNTNASNRQSLQAAVLKAIIDFQKDDKAYATAIEELSTAAQSISDEKSKLRQHIYKAIQVLSTLSDLNTNDDQDKSLTDALESASNTFTHSEKLRSKITTLLNNKFFFYMPDNDIEQQVAAKLIKKDSARHNQLLKEQRLFYTVAPLLPENLEETTTDIMLIFAEAITKLSLKEDVNKALTTKATEFIQYTNRLQKPMVAKAYNSFSSKISSVTNKDEQAILLRKRKSLLSIIQKADTAQFSDNDKAAYAFWDVIHDYKTQMNGRSWFNKLFFTSSKRTRQLKDIEERLNKYFELAGNSKAQQANFNELHDFLTEKSKEIKSELWFSRFRRGGTLYNAIKNHEASFKKPVASQEEELIPATVAHELAARDRAASTDSGYDTDSLDHTPSYQSQYSSDQESTFQKEDISYFARIIDNDKKIKKLKNRPIIDLISGNAQHLRPNFLSIENIKNLVPADNLSAAVETGFFTTLLYQQQSFPKDLETDKEIAEYCYKQLRTYINLKSQEIIEDPQSSASEETLTTALSVLDLLKRAMLPDMPEQELEITFWATLFTENTDELKAPFIEKYSNLKTILRKKLTTPSELTGDKLETTVFKRMGLEDEYNESYEHEYKKFKSTIQNYFTVIEEEPALLSRMPKAKREQAVQELENKLQTYVSFSDIEHVDINQFKKTLESRFNFLLAFDDSFLSINLLHSQREYQDASKAEHRKQYISSYPTLLACINLAITLDDTTNEDEKDKLIKEFILKLTPDNFNEDHWLIPQNIIDKINLIMPQEKSQAINALKQLLNMKPDGSTGNLNAIKDSLRDMLPQAAGDEQRARSDTITSTMSSVETLKSTTDSSRLVMFIHNLNGYLKNFPEFAKKDLFGANFKQLQLLMTQHETTCFFSYSMLQSALQTIKADTAALEDTTNWLNKLTEKQQEAIAFNLSVNRIKQFLEQNPVDIDGLHTIKIKLQVLVQCHYDLIPRDSKNYAELIKKAEEIITRASQKIGISSETATFLSGQLSVALSPEKPRVNRYGSKSTTTATFKAHGDVTFKRAFLSIKEAEAKATALQRPNMGIATSSPDIFANQDAASGSTEYQFATGLMVTRF